MTTFRQFTWGILGANHYILRDTASGEAVLVECAERKPDIPLLRDAGVKMILLTHGHFDHACSAAIAAKELCIPVAIGADDAELVRHPKQILSSELSFPFQPLTPDLLLHDGDEIPFGNDVIRVIATPGHTGGSVCYAVGDYLLTGDTLMRRTIGRTDFDGSDPGAMRQSLARLSSLDRDYTVLPGHGDVTTLREEILYNPFF